MQPTRAAVSQWIGEYLVKELQLPPETIQPDTTFDTYGLDSLEQAVMAGMMEDAFEIELEINKAFTVPTIRGVVDALVQAGIVENA